MWTHREEGITVEIIRTQPPNLLRDRASEMWSLDQVAEIQFPNEEQEHVSLVLALWLYFLMLVCLGYWHCNCFTRGIKEEALGPKEITVDWVWLTMRKVGPADSLTRRDPPISAAWRIVSLSVPVVPHSLSGLSQLCFSLNFCHFTSLLPPTPTTLTHLLPFIDWVAHHEIMSTLNK